MKRPSTIPYVILSTFAAIAWAVGQEPPVDPDQVPDTRRELLRKQREERRQQLQPYEISSWENRILNWEKSRGKLTEKGYGGFRLLIGGIDDPALFGSASSGSGFVGGIGYVNGLNRDGFLFSLDARYSTRSYENVLANLEFPNRRSEKPVHAFLQAGYRDYKEVNFFGLGPATSTDGESSFRLEDRRVTAGISLLPHRTTIIRGGVGYLNTHILSGDDPPSAERLFGPVDLPGFADSPDYATYLGQLELNFFDRGLPPAGVRFNFEFMRFDDRDQGLYDFNRVTADFMTEFPLGYRNRRLAFRFRTSHSMPDSGDQVPFYMMETLGGGTSLRGFDNYRFRDRRNLLMNLEYRWEVWTFADFALFADAGKVFRRWDDFDFRNLEAGYGFGLIIRSPVGGGTFRIDVSNSHEGFKIFIGSGPFIDKSALGPPPSNFILGKPKSQR